MDFRLLYRFSGLEGEKSHTGTLFQQTPNSAKILNWFVCWN